jgi:hypothetical protein
LTAAFSPKGAVRGRTGRGGRGPASVLRRARLVSSRSGRLPRPGQEGTSVAPPAKAGGVRARMAEAYVSLSVAHGHQAVEKMPKANSREPAAGHLSPEHERVAGAPTQGMPRHAAVLYDAPFMGRGAAGPHEGVGKPFCLMRGKSDLSHHSSPPVNIYVKSPPQRTDTENRAQE